MAESSWSHLEGEVRNSSSVIWGGAFHSELVHGRQIDAYCLLDSQQAIAVEVTEKKDIRKLQDDISKLVHVRTVNFNNGFIVTTCIHVTSYPPTDAMRAVARSLNVDLYSIEDYRNKFLPFEKYYDARIDMAFGSATDPETGNPDKRKYIRVNFTDGERIVSNDTVLGSVLSGRKIIIIGENGTGKSKFSEYAFKRLSESARKTGIFPIAIDLRRSWGLTDRYEIIRRHLKDVGLSSYEDAFIKAYNKKMLCIFLDGFDEVGSQSWSDSAESLRNLRASALSGARDLIVNNKGGIIVSGREHYFDSREEMASSLGMASSDTIIIETKTEFSEDEAKTFLQESGYDAELPAWLPKKPLTCEFYVRAFGKDEQASESDGPLKFWDHYHRRVCEREAALNPAFDPDSISRVLVSIAAVTRTKQENVGPISLSEIREAFERAVGYTPIDQASVLLQRLSGLGRSSSDSEDRRFVDTYLLDGLRAVHVLEHIRGNVDHGYFDIEWTNPVSSHGASICAQKLIDLEIVDDAISFCHSISRRKNKTLAGDVLSSICLAADGLLDLSGLTINGAYIGSLDLSNIEVSNLHIEDCVIENFIFPVAGVTNFKVRNSNIARAAGVSNAAGTPKWMESSSIEEFTSVETTSRIRASNVSPGQKILLTIIHKTFFQSGAGRKEEALFRGLGKIADTKTVNSIVKKLISEGILIEDKGDTGRIYVPVRSQTRRVGKMSAELNMCKDPVWLYAATLS